jgi:hypothetical protein
LKKTETKRETVFNRNDTNRVVLNKYIQHNERLTTREYT